MPHAAKRLRHSFNSFHLRLSMIILDRINQLLRSGADNGSSEPGVRVSRKQLVNRINHLNFQNLPLLAILNHKNYDTKIAVNAIPQPCTGERLRCLWAEPTEPGRKLDSHDFQCILLFDGRKIVLVKPELQSADKNGISLLLPETGTETGIRRIQRHQCEGILVGLAQNGIQYQGFLHDFTPVAFRVQIATDYHRGVPWIDSSAPVHLSFSDGRQTFFSGECRIIRQDCIGKTASYVLEPLHHQIRRFQPREFRAVRQILNPSPEIMFRHPLTGRQVSLKVIDLSGSGFSVEEDEGHSLLVPGLVIPGLELCFDESFRIGCSAQVIYRNATGTGSECGTVKCGLAVLDMLITDQVRLMRLLQQAADGNSSVCNRVDMDALWDFFFETGFIYPDKYAFLQSDKAAIKGTYERLYNNHPDIARHFIYQDKGMILGHMAMVRLHENSWLIHHHAARKVDSAKAGLAVLNQIGRYVNDVHHLRSAYMDYVFCYFRPDNKFPSRVFGGFARHLERPQQCSLDTFAYYHFQPPAGSELLPVGEWELGDAVPDDYDELGSFYEHVSGGLLLDSFGLKTPESGHDRLAAHYRDLGFRNERRVFALRQHGRLKAFIMAIVSDVGLNMSNLTSSATVIVLDGFLPREVFDHALSSVAGLFGPAGMPVLVYPESYAGRAAITTEKSYTLWVLNLQYLDKYFKFCDELFKGNHNSSHRNGTGELHGANSA
jgi:hypothetical protein